MSRGGLEIDCTSDSSIGVVLIIELLIVNFFPHIASLESLSTKDSA